MSATAQLKLPLPKGLPETSNHFSIFLISQTLVNASSQQKLTESQVTKSLRCSLQSSSPRDIKKKKSREGKWKVEGEHYPKQVTRFILASYNELGNILSLFSGRGHEHELLVNWIFGRTSWQIIWDYCFFFVNILNYSLNFNYGFTTEVLFL